MAKALQSLAILLFSLCLVWNAAVPMQRYSEHELDLEDEDFADGDNGFSEPSLDATKESTSKITDSMRFQETSAGTSASTCAFWSKMETSGTPPDDRSKAAVLTLGGGARFLVAGGQSATAGVDSLSMLDAKTRAWSSVVGGGDAGGVARLGAALATLPGEAGDGSASLFMFGGISKGALQNDLTMLSASGDATPTATWAKVDTQGEPPSARQGATLSPLPDRRMILIGGLSDSESFADVWILRKVAAPGDVYSWALGQEQAGGATFAARSRHSAAVWSGSNGERVVVYGGLAQDGTVLGDLSVLNPSTSAGGVAWTSPTLSGALPKGVASARTDHSAAVIGDTMYIFGGCSKKACNADVLSLNLASMSWGKVTFGDGGLGQAPAGRGGAAVVVVDKALYFVQGCGVAGDNCASGKDVAVLDTATSCTAQCQNGGVMEDGVCKCTLDFTGKFCSTAKASSSDSSPSTATANATDCLNSCSGHGACEAGVCKCAAGYDGADCSNKLPLPCKDDCNGHGACVEGVCQCEEAYFGKTCGSRSCPGATPCSGNGECQQDVGSCSCYPGYGGDDCAQSGLCPGNCTATANGVCTAKKETSGNSTTTSYSCVCADGFTGKACGKDTRCPKKDTNTTSPCSGHGKCSNFACTCAPGYGGDLCEYRACPLDCSGNGVCNKATGVCRCDVKFRGPNCSAVPTCEKPCGGNGVCVRDDDVDVENMAVPPRVDGKCQCQASYSGPQCDVRACAKGTVDMEADPLPCSGPTRGSCDNSTGVCTCLPGFGGSACDQECPVGKIRKAGIEGGHVTNATCAGRGQCVTSPAGNAACLCESGRKGRACEEELPCPGSATTPCSGHGRCYASLCFCRPGWKGEDCATQTACPKAVPAGVANPTDNTTVSLEGVTCNGKGLCHEGVCFCAPGWNGTACSIKQTCPGDCSGHGTCSGGKCFCAPGWAGDACLLELPCKNACSGHGICHFTKCVCEPGFSGDDCSTFDVELDSAASTTGDAGAGARFAQSRVSMGVALSAGPSAKAGCNNDCGGAKQGACVLGRCVCLPGFDGESCSPQPSNCDPACAKHGVCKFNKCFCNPGWQGSNCSTAVPCKDNCNGKGKCKYGQCYCQAGFRGLACDVEVTCPNSCNDRGICLGGRCLCNPGFGGDDCSQVTQGTEICPKACSGHGTCSIGQCFCDPGWAGRDCAYQLPSPCPNDCFGQGKCSHGKCFCNPGFSGEDCGTALPCPPGCGKHGVCRYGRCFCQRGYAGLNCSRAVAAEEAAAKAAEEEKRLATPAKPCPNACSLHGFCYKGMCMCEPGYDGVSCERVTLGHKQCPNDCRGLNLQGMFPGSDAGASPRRGLCSLGKCFCYPGFAGAACEAEVATPCPGDCSGNGDCRFGKCFCRVGYEGEACQKELKDCPHDCHANGVCTRGRCLCHLGYTGEYCGQVVAAAPCPNKCSGKGVCIMGKCVCQAGYSGNGCQHEEASQQIVQAVANETDADLVMRASANPDTVKREVVQLNETALQPSFDLSGSIQLNLTHQGKGFVTLKSPGQKLIQKLNESLTKKKLIALSEGIAPSLANASINSSPNKTKIPLLPAVATNASTANASSRFASRSTQGVLLEVSSASHACESGCNEHGMCHQGSCYCYPGFTGSDCASKVACPGDCGDDEQGLCHNGRCFCSPGFQGDDCSLVVQCPAGCNNRGSCHRGKCVCHPLFSGEECEVEELSASVPPHPVDFSSACPQGCSAHGLCRAGSCFCASGYTGDACDKQVVSSEPIYTIPVEAMVNTSNEPVQVYTAGIIALSAFGVGVLVSAIWQARA